MEQIKRLIKQKIVSLSRRKVKIEEELPKLPKGTVNIKKLGNNYYYYLCYRVGSKSKKDYIGKKEPVRLIKQIEKRQSLTRELIAIKKDLYKLERVKL